jgi:hypothetical protein
MPTTFKIAETLTVSKVVKATTHFINLEFEVEGHIFNSPFGLSVSNTAGEDAKELLDRMVEAGNTDALDISLKEISIGDDFLAHTQDMALDNLIQSRPVSLMLDAKKKYESTLFWLSFKVTSIMGADGPEYFDGELSTGSIAFTSKANRDTLSKLLKVINDDTVDFNTKIRDVSYNAPKQIKLKKPIPF